MMVDKMPDQRSFVLSRSSLSIAPPMKVTLWMISVAPSALNVLRQDLMTWVPRENPTSETD